MIAVEEGNDTEVSVSPVPKRSEKTKGKSKIGKLKIRSSSSDSTLSLSSDDESMDGELKPPPLPSKIHLSWRDVIPKEDLKGFLLSFLPDFFTTKLSSDPKSYLKSGSVFSDCAFITLCISSLDSVAHDFAAKGQTSLNSFYKYTNQLFSSIVSVITKHRGEIVQWESELMIIMWRKASKDATFEAPALQAGACALDLLQLLDRTSHDESKLYHIEIQPILAVGRLYFNHVASEKGQNRLIITGENLTRGLQSYAECTLSNKILVITGCWDAFSANFSGLATEDEFFHLVALLSPYTPSALLTEDYLPPVVENEDIVIEVLQSYITPNSSKIATCVSKSGTLLQITISNIDPYEMSSTERFLPAFMALQRVINRYEGQTHSFSSCQNGIVALASFGLPPYEYENAAIRASKAALALKRDISRFGLRFSIGIATGTVICGNFQAGSKRANLLLGNLVTRCNNLTTIEVDDVRCDKETFDASRGAISFDTTGFEETKDAKWIFRPLGEIDQVQLNLPKVPSIVAGRSKHLEILANKLQDLTDTGRGGVVFIEADSGYGKSMLISETTRLAAEAVGGTKISILISRANSMDLYTPYYIFRGIFSSLFEIDSAMAPEYNERTILGHIDTSQMRSLVPLLGDVIPYLSIKDNKFTKRLNKEARSLTTCDFLVALLTLMSKKTPILIILEDAQWMDPSSWNLVQALSVANVAVMTVIATTEISEKYKKAQTVLSSTKCYKLSLPAISAEVVEKIMYVDEVPVAMVQAVYKKSDGNPFYAKELTLSLLNDKAFTIKSGICLFQADLLEAKFHTIPTSMPELIRQRLVRMLSASQIKLLRTASVLGYSFPLELLQYVMTQTHIHEMISIESDLSHLVNNGILSVTRELHRKYLCYSFKNVVLKDAFYETVENTQLPNHHKIAAMWYESNESSSYYALAHHWTLAGEPSTAILYYEKAADQHKEDFAITEAVHLYHKELALIDSSNLLQEQFISHKSHVYTSLGLGYLHLDELGECFKYLCTALEYYGIPLPHSGISLHISLVKQTLIHTIHKLFQRRSTDGTYAIRPADELCDIYTTLTRFFLHSGSITFARYTCLAATNISENLHFVSQMSKNYSYLGSLRLTEGKTLRAHKYLNMALSLAKDSKDPDARMLAQEKIGMYYHSTCQWDSSLRSYTKISKLAVKFGSKRYYDQSVTLMASWNHSKGNFSREYKYAREGYEANKKRGDNQQTALAICFLAHALISADKSEEAIKLIKDESKESQDNQEFRDNIVKFCSTSLLALAYVYARNLAYVYEIIEESIHSLNPGVQPTFYGYMGYTALIECCIVLYNSNPIEKIPLIIPYMKHLLHLLERHSEIYPISKCGYLYWKGSFHFAMRNKKEAFKEWNKGLKMAESLDMPFEQALCLYAIGKNDKSNYETSENYLDQSMKIFKKLGANHQLEAVKRKKREKHKFSGSLIFANMKQHNQRNFEVLYKKKDKPTEKV